MLDGKLIGTNWTEEGPCLSKGQWISKAFFLETALPKKRTRYLTKFCPINLGQNFVKYFFCFLSNGVSRKNVLIYWPLVKNLTNYQNPQNRAISFKLLDKLLHKNTLKITQKKTFLYLRPYAWWKAHRDQLDRRRTLWGRGQSNRGCIPRHSSPNDWISRAWTFDCQRVRGWGPHNCCSCSPGHVSPW